MAAQTRAIPLPLRAQGRGRSRLLAYGSKSSATTPLCTVLIHFPRGSRSLSPRDDLEIALPRFPAFIPARNKSRSPASLPAPNPCSRPRASFARRQSCAECATLTSNSPALLSEPVPFLTDFFFTTLVQHYGALLSSLFFPPFSICFPWLQAKRPGASRAASPCWLIEGPAVATC